MQPGADNVLMVTRELSGDRRYGLGRSLLPLVDALVGKGWRVRYLCQEDLPDNSKKSRQKWVQRFNCLPGLRGSAQRQAVVAALAERLQMGWFAAHIARVERFGNVHLHDPWIALGFRLGAWAKGVRGVRWGITEHGFGSYSSATHEDGLLQGERLQRCLRRLEASALIAAQWVIAPTHLSLVQLARDMAMPHVPAHWHVLPHALASQPLPDRLQARKVLNWQPDALYILGVGRIVPLKRFDCLVEAFAQLARSGIRCHLQILGEGDAQALFEIAQKHGVAGQLHVAAVDDVNLYLAAADVYVSTSSTESFGLANLEALSAGLPCICTAVGGVPEVMGAGAQLIPLNMEVLLDCLHEMLVDAQVRAAWAQRAKRHGKHIKNIEWVTQRYVEILQS
jgi:glycosyltransferase involved in cell wall biosynthesis